MAISSQNLDEIVKAAKHEALCHVCAKLPYTDLQTYNTEDTYRTYCKQEIAAGHEPYPKDQIVMLMSIISTRDDDGVNVTPDQVKEETRNLFDCLKRNNFGYRAVVTQIGLAPELYIVDSRRKEMTGNGKSL